MNFTNNFAYLGGAIYSFAFPGECTNYVGNRRCIIQYNDPEQEDVPVENWQVCSFPPRPYLMQCHITPLLRIYSVVLSLCIECELCLCWQFCEDWWCCVVRQ